MGLAQATIKKEKEMLTLSLLASYDDIITDALVDRVYFWTTIRKNRTRYSACRGIRDEEVADILRQSVIVQKNPSKACAQLLELPGLKRFFLNLPTEDEKEHFQRHLRKYIDMYMPDCPFEVSTTNRYTIDTQEAAITARKNIRKGELIKYLSGIQVPITKEEEKDLDITRRDFSIVMSSRKRTPSIFLGPARFANHDCGANARLTTRGANGMAIVATKDIRRREEITVTYGEDYFGEDNCECLCATCEESLRNGWAPVEQCDESQSETAKSMNDLGTYMAGGPKRRKLAAANQFPAQTGEDISPLMRGNHCMNSKTRRLTANRPLQPRSQSLRLGRTRSSLRHELGRDEHEDTSKTQNHERGFQVSSEEASINESTRSSVAPSLSFANSQISTSSTAVTSDSARGPETDKALDTGTRNNIVRVQVALYHAGIDAHGTLVLPTHERNAATVNSPTSLKHICDTTTYNSTDMVRQASRVIESGILQETTLNSTAKSAPMPSTETGVEFNVTSTPFRSFQNCVEKKISVSEIEDNPMNRGKNLLQRDASKTDIVVHDATMVSYEPALTAEDDTSDEVDISTTCRIPGDYTLTKRLLAAPFSRWVECRTCCDHFVQNDAYQTRISCPRCERHSKLYGYAWPKTDKVNKWDTEERILDHRTVNRFISQDQEKEIRKGKGSSLKELLADMAGRSKSGTNDESDEETNDEIRRKNAKILRKRHPVEVAVCETQSEPEQETKHRKKHHKSQFEGRDKSQQILSNSYTNDKAIARGTYESSRVKRKYVWSGKYAGREERRAEKKKPDMALIKARAKMARKWKGWVEIDEDGNVVDPLQDVPTILPKRKRAPEEDQDAGEEPPRKKAGRPVKRRVTQERNDQEHLHAEIQPPPRKRGRPAKPKVAIETDKTASMSHGMEYQPKKPERTKKRRSTGEYDAWLETMAKRHPAVTTSNNTRPKLLNARRHENLMFVRRTVANRKYAGCQKNPAGIFKRRYARTGKHGKSTAKVNIDLLLRHEAYAESRRSKPDSVFMSRQGRGRPKKAARHDTQICSVKKQPPKHEPDKKIVKKEKKEKTSTRPGWKGWIEITSDDEIPVPLLERETVIRSVYSLSHCSSPELSDSSESRWPFRV